MPRGGLLLHRQNPENLCSHGDDSGQGHPQGRRHRRDGFQRSGRFPEPPQRRQRGLYPPVAPADDRSGPQAASHDQLLRARRPAPQGSLRPGSRRHYVHRRQRQPAAFDAGRAAQRRKGGAHGVPRRDRRGCGCEPDHRGAVRRYGLDADRPAGGQQDLLHVSVLLWDQHRGHEESAQRHDQRLSGCGAVRGGQQAGFGGDHLDEQHGSQTCGGRHQYAHLGVQRGRYRRQAPGFDHHGRFHQVAPGDHRPRAGRRRREYRELQEEQPDVRPLVGGRAEHFGEFEIQDRRALGREPDQCRGVYSLLFARCRHGRRTDTRHGLGGEPRDRHADRGLQRGGAAPRKTPRQQFGKQSGDPRIG